MNSLFVGSVGLRGDRVCAPQAFESRASTRTAPGKPLTGEEANVRDMLRLMGLPHVGRFPKATVTRHGDRFQVLFHGGEHSRRVDIDLQYMEDAADLEATELRLLAHLQEVGYEVERRSPSPPEGGAGS